MTEDDLNRLATLIVDRVNLAVISEIPKGLVESVVDNHEMRMNLVGGNATTNVQVIVIRRGRYLEVRFDSYNQTWATFRLEGR